ncbi:MAG: phosphotransferase family protein [Porticoccaceae bacterium]
MIRPEILLENILASLQRDIAPELHSAKAKAAAASMARALARMSLYVSSGEGRQLDSPEGWFATDPALRQFHSNPVLPPQTRNSATLAEPCHREWLTLAKLEDAMSTLLETDEPAQNPGTSAPQADTGKKLEAYLQSRFSAPEARVSDFQEVVGGRSKQTAFFTVSGLAQMSGTLVLRCDLQVNLSGGKSIAYEYPLQKILADHGLRVPRPLLLEIDPRHIGQPFMVVEKLPGAVAGQYFYPPTSPSLLADYAAELARLHAVPADAFSGLDMDSTPLPRGALAAEIERLRATCSECGTLSLILETAYAWLLENLEVAYRDRPCLAHRDALFHNVLAEGERVCALLDWELARISCAAEDLGYIRSTVPLAMPWDTFMAHYEKAAGRVMDQRQVDYFAILSVARNCSMASNVRRLVAQRETRDIELTSVTLHDLYRMQYQLGEHLDRAMGR